MGGLMVGYGALDAHDLLRLLAARFHGIEPERVVLGHRCPRCGADGHGRPLLLPTSSLRAPAQVSLARAGSLAVAAITEAGSIGVDLEADGAAGFDGFADVALHRDERGRDDVDPTTLWVRKEALLKASGLGLAIDPRDVRAIDDGDASLPASEGGRRRAWLRDVDVPGHRAAVAVLATDLSALEGLEPTVSRW